MPAPSSDIATLRAPRTRAEVEAYVRNERRLEREDVVAQSDAFIADEDARAADHLLHFPRRLQAERTRRGGTQLGCTHDRLPQKLDVSG